MPGQVENYMTEIVVKMRGELRDVLRDSVVDYTTKPRDKWLFDWPSQIILVVNQVFWCQEVEQVKLCLLLSQTAGQSLQ
jgi:dynein heavy chain